MTGFSMQQYNYKNPIQLSEHVREVKRGDNTMHDLLFDLLSLASPSRHEDKVRALIQRWVNSSGPPGVLQFTDSAGNYHVKIGDVGNTVKTIFSCHMDTVHHRADTITPVITLGNGENSHRVYGTVKTTTATFTRSDTGELISASDLPALCKELGGNGKYALIPIAGMPDTYQMRVHTGTPGEKGDTAKLCDALHLTKGQAISHIRPEVLGADDKLGCYILCRMIEQGIPGWYIFHVGEEAGGIGSNWLASNKANDLSRMERCVAFDRMGYTDVVSFQCAGDTASSQFTWALAAALNQYMPPNSRYKGAVHGVFTDSANYSHLIPECTNLSVGYFKQHGSQEHFDLVFLEMVLLPAVLKVNWETLGAFRRPAEKKFARGYGSYYGDPNTDDHEDYEAWWGKYMSSKYGLTSDDRDQKVINLPDRSKPPTQDKKAMADISEFVPVAEVTKTTPLAKVPDWVPADGVLHSASQEGMARIISKFLMKNNATYSDMAAYMVDLFTEIKALEVEIMQLQSDLDDLDDDV